MCGNPSRIWVVLSRSDSWVLVWLNAPMEIQERPKDHKFTLKYAQPDEYHFCLDSILLPRLVADLTRETLVSGATVMDMGAGCGVLGFELLFYRSDIQKMVFVEKQKIFEPYWHENKKKLQTILACSARCEFSVQDIRNLREADRGAYDLLLVNPPYYFEDEGPRSPNETKAHCHFFLNSMPEDFVKAVEYFLRPHGEAYILMKKPERWTEALTHACALSCNQVATVRGTPVMQLKKRPA